MITTRSIAATLGRLALMGTMAGAHLTTVAAAEPKDVSPGWSAGERDWFRSFSQGSQLLPYEWFRALELPDAPILFRADGLARYGYIPRPADISNPDGLPVGFAIDRDRAGVWVGMSCAACHTGKVEVNGRALLIDGAPGNGDLSGLIDGLAASMRATLADPAKQARFIDRVTPRSRPLTREQLAASLAATSADFDRFADESRPAATRWGPARADAFGMIFNRVTRIDLGVAGNTQRPEGPVSYPHLWHSNRTDRVQWNGGIPNIRPHERLGRNLGQVLGVFGRMPRLGRPGIDPLRFESSVRARALLRVDRYIDRLGPPPWPAAGIDTAMTARGEAIYFRRDASQNPTMCAACHVDASRVAGTIRTTLVPVDLVGTDPRVAELIAGRTSASGPLQGKPLGRFERFPFVGRRLARTEPTADLLSVVVTHALLSPSIWRDDVRAPRAAAPAAVASAAEGQRAVAAIRAAETAPFLAASVAEAGRDRSKLVYKAGPLNGIWATAPYLHNGSVPTLADLLLPTDRRPKRFDVGSRRLDVLRVGFEATAGSGTSFDTGVDGNRNTGHDGPEYGATLTADERRDLLEFLKTL